MPVDAAPLHCACSSGTVYLPLLEWLRVWGMLNRQDQLLFNVLWDGN